MAEQTKVKTLEKVVIRFSGDSGDGMQLTGQQFSDAAALFGNGYQRFRIILLKYAPRKVRLWCFRVPSTYRE